MRLNDNSERDPVLSEAAEIGRHREFILDHALVRIVQAVPEVESAVEVKRDEVEVERYPQNVVKMGMDKQHQQESEQAEEIGYWGDVIDAIYEEKNAA